MISQFRTWAVLALVMSCSIPLVAQEAEWVETNSWQGVGSQQTAIFFVTAAKWRVIYRPKGKGPFAVELNRESGHDPVPVTDQKGGSVLSGRRNFTGAGRHYLDIQTEQAEWQLVVEQLLTPVQQWQLVQLTKQDVPTLSRIATWTGAEGDEEFEVRIPRGSWKLFVNVIGEGQADATVSLVGADRDSPVLHLAQLAAGDRGTWIHQSGVSRVRLHAGENCEWKLDVCTAK